MIADLDRGDRVLESAERTRPDVAVLDIDMPGLDGLAVAAQLHERLPGCRTLILTGLSQPGNLLRALRAHVRGFIVKDAPADRLADGIRRIAAGQRVIDPELVGIALDTGRARSPAGKQTCSAAAAGIPTDQIGTRLSLSPATVRNYLSSAISKIGGHNRIDAIRIARENGWL